MSVALEITRAWRHPRQVMRRLLDAGRREDRALLFLMVACLLIFVAQWPRLVRAAELDASVPLDARMGGALLGWLFLAPLLAYALGAVSHIVLRLIGGQGDWFGARLALFWALLAAAPFWLVNGLITGFAGDGFAGAAFGAIALAAFLLIWITSLIEAEFGKGQT